MMFVYDFISQIQMLPLIYVFLEKSWFLEMYFGKNKTHDDYFDILCSFSAIEEFVDLLIWLTKFVSGFIHVDHQCGNVHLMFIFMSVLIYQVNVAVLSYYNDIYRHIF